MNQEVNTKRCNSCSLIKPFAEFSKLKSSKDGFQHRCKKCHNQLNYKWRIKNPNYLKTWNKINFKRKKASDKKWYLNNLKRHKNNCKNWRLNNLEYDKRKKREWNSKNKENINRHSMKKYHENLDHRIKHCYRNRIRLALKNHQKSGHTLELLGCTISELKNHIEKQFKNGMSWNNYGRFGWHIDHIIPCDNFNMLDVNQQKKCFHYTNLQPLWWKENLTKSNKLIPQ